MANDKYFRIVYFKDNKYLKTVITGDEAEVKRLINLQTRDIKIYRCNQYGNNYTGRRIY